jgi:hypothetical protein
MPTAPGFELWDFRSGNLVADYSTEAQALVALAVAVDRHGEAYVGHQALSAISLSRMKPSNRLCHCRRLLSP